MIRTERLLLRRWRDADRQPFSAMNADPIVREFLQGPIERHQSDAFIDATEEHWDQHGWALWAVEVPGVAPFIGYVGLWPADYLPSGPAVEVGWRLAREALRFGFEAFRLDEVVSFTVPQNRRSIAVMRRIGMVRDPARDFDHPHVDAEAHPDLVRHVFFEISHERWLANRIQFQQ